MLKKLVFAALMVLCLAGCSHVTTAKESLDLSGRWQFQLGLPAQAETLTPPAVPLAVPDTLNDTIVLPGTTDTNHKGHKTTVNNPISYTRRYEHIGRAWYQRTITVPDHWQGQDIELFIERALWKTTVYLDGQLKGDCDSLGTPHMYNLGPVTPGEHLLTVCVDNSMIYNIGDKAHSYSENMQTIWNGMLGELQLRPLPKIHINAVRTRLESAMSPAGQWLLSVDNTTDRSTACVISCELTGAGQEKKTSTYETRLEPGVQTVSCPLVSNLKYWDEFTPNLYEARITVQAGQQSATWNGTIGFCLAGSDGTHITINGRPTFLRGNLDNCHFPLTGHPPMDKADWLRVWNIYKDFGYNHVRFHTWCPPEAAFAAADEAGIYIQVESGVWIDGWMKNRLASHPDGITNQTPEIRDYIRREMKCIVDAYGHHPSFVMFCVGNELGNADFDLLAEMVSETRRYDGTTSLSSCSTARQLLPEVDDYFVSHQNLAGSMRGLRGPKTNWTYDAVKKGAPKTPLILHELGQWPIWPNWSEIDKYTGVVEARNLQGFRELAKKNNVFSQDAEFQAATGKFSLLLYKAEMEGALRSKTYAGFHSLGLQDYMGQGEAMIGILDMFYDLKPGIISPQQYRQFCCPVVPLAQFEKYVWTSGQTFSALMQVSNFSPAAVGGKMTWKLESQNGQTLKQGEFEQTLAQGTVTDLGRISVPLETDTPLACRLELAIVGTPYKNSWPIWVYPAPQAIETSTVVVAESFDEECIQALRAGKNVLLMAANCMTAENTHRNTFLPVYWSTGWFPGQPRTLGLTCNPAHPLFQQFPTEGHCDWQWYDLVDNSSAMILNDVPAEYRPIVQPVDDFHLARKLGAIFESKVGRGKLLVCVYPLNKRLDSPACRQLYTALLAYASSDKFSPKTELPMNWLAKNLTALTPAKVVSQSPVGSGPAGLWVRVAEKIEPVHQSLPYDPKQDVIDVRKEGYAYQLSGDGVWRDPAGRFIWGKTLGLTVDLPKGVEGTLYVKFSDCDRNGRTGKIVFENRSFVLTEHAGKEGRWLEFTVMREDALDNAIQLTAETISGPNLQIDEFVFIPNN